MPLIGSCQAIFLDSDPFSTSIAWCDHLRSGAFSSWLFHMDVGDACLKLSSFGNIDTKAVERERERFTFDTFWVSLLVLDPKCRVRDSKSVQIMP